LTNVPGSSAYFQGTVVAYSDFVKTQLLGVNPATLSQHGAVSEETTREMAAGVRERLDADIGVAVTGIAGPGGATKANPIGAACFALATDGTVVSKRYQLWGDREWIKALISQLALDWVRRSLLGISISESGFIRK
jgi:nicotinamide-nucleotide amidase